MGEIKWIMKPNHKDHKHEDFKTRIVSLTELFQLSTLGRDTALEVVPCQVEDRKGAEVSNLGGDRTSETVGVDLELFHVGKVANLGGQRSPELVVPQTKVLEVWETSKGNREVSGQVVEI